MSQQPGNIIPGDEPVVADRRRLGAPVDYDTHDSIEVKNRVQFGPIIAGVLTAIAIMIILTVLGIAVGSSALEPRDVGKAVGTGAAIWGIVSAIIAFFAGGWVAAKTAAVAGSGSGLINGLMVGAAILAIVLWLTGTGVSGLIGLLGSNIRDIADLAKNQGATVQDAQNQAQQIDPQAVFNSVKDSAWWTLLGIIVPLIAAAIGGLVGHNEREDVIQSGR